MPAMFLRHLVMPAVQALQMTGRQHRGIWHCRSTSQSHRCAAALRAAFLCRRVAPHCPQAKGRGQLLQCCLQPCCGQRGCGRSLMAALAMVQRAASGSAGSTVSYVAAVTHPVVAALPPAHAGAANRCTHCFDALSHKALHKSCVANLRPCDDDAISCTAHTLTLCCLCCCCLVL